jgi:predicted amidophosphoribosyltransferase
VHGDGDCPEPVAWSRGEALWEYHGGRPPLGALLVPGIKAGEDGWRKALLGRVAQAPLPELPPLDVVMPVPTQSWKRLWRGFDLAEEAAGVIAGRLSLPVRRGLRKGWRAPSQAGLTESQRRRLPAKAFHLGPGAKVDGKAILLVDDVWTTGTSLLRCARLLQGAGAQVSVLTLFRST